jgi:hypothetical protein
MGREMNCLTLSDLTRSLPLAVLTPLRSIMEGLTDFFLCGHGASMAPFNALDIAEARVESSKDN